MELNTKSEAYNEKVEVQKPDGKTPEEMEKERQFWLNVKYSDEHSHSDR